MGSTPRPRALWAILTVDSGILSDAFKTVDLTDADPHQWAVLVYVHEISVMEGHCRIINRPDNCPRTW